MCAFFQFASLLLCPLCRTDYTNSYSTSGTTYFLNFCANTIASPASCTTGHGPAILYTTSACRRMAPLPATYKLYDANNTGGGLSLTYPVGDVCSNTNIQLTVNMPCPPPVDPPPARASFTVTQNGCVYTFTVSSTANCPLSGPSKLSGGPSKLSGGWIFVIVVVVLLFVYVVSGCLFLHFRRGASTLRDSCPNYGFWSVLPPLCWEGCNFTYRSISSLLARCFGHGKTPYQQPDGSEFH